MVVGVDRFLRSEAIAARQFGRTVRDHLVGVHVARRARAGLKDVDRELIVELSFVHLAAGGEHRFDLLVRDRVLAAGGELPQIAVRHARGILDEPQGMDQIGRQRPTGDRKILDRPLRLRAVIRRRRHANVSHRVVLDPIFSHEMLQTYDRNGKKRPVSQTTKTFFNEETRKAGERPKEQGSVPKLPLVRSCLPGFLIKNLCKSADKHFLLLMQVAGAAVAFGGSAEAVSAVRHLAVEPTPERQAEWNVQDRGEPPQPTQAPREITDRLRAPMPLAVAIHDHHLLHQLVVRQVGIAARHLRIVQRQVGELPLAVPPGEFSYLRRADPAMAVVDDYVGAGPLIGGRQRPRAGRQGLGAGGWRLGCR
jgi:hypothetical protein